MALKNYINVSFYSDRAGFDRNIVIRGCWQFTLKGKATFNDIKESLAKGIKEKRSEYAVAPEDLTITGINEISRRLYKRLTK